MTSSHFNPYRDWLGLESPPSNYYELLGLSAGETDLARIRAAATRTLSRLRSIQPGRRQERWKSLLDQLQAAQACLLTADTKSRYDQRLGLKSVAPPRPAEGSAPSPRAAAAPPFANADPMAPVEFVDSAASPGAPVREPSPQSPAPSAASLGHRSVVIERVGLEAGRTRSMPTGRVLSRQRSVGRRGNRSARHSLAFVYGVTAVCFVGVLGTFLAVIQLWVLPARDQRQRQQAVLPRSARDLPLPSDPAEGHGARASSPLAPRASVPSAGLDESAASDASDLPVPVARTPDPPPKGPDGPTKTLVPVIPSPPGGVASSPSLDDGTGLAADTRDEVHELLRQAFAATADARWSDADRSLRRASVLAGETWLRDRVERFSVLRDYVQQYRQAALADGWEGLEGSELVIDGTRVFVVEANDRQLVIHREGQNERFGREQLPTEIVMAIADRWFDGRAATTPVFRGAFMLVKPEFRLQETRDAWQLAEASGANLGDLMQILDDLKSLEVRDE